MFATRLSHLWCVTDVFRYAWRYWLDFWFECIVISYRSSLHFVLVQWFFAELCPWTLKFGQIFSCHHFISLWFEILTWFLVWECIIISYRSTLKFVRLNDFWPTYSRWALKFGQIFISLSFEILTWFLVFGITTKSYRSSLAFVPTQ